MREVLHQRATLGKDIDESIRSTRLAGERDVDLPVDILNPEGCVAGWHYRIGERIHEIEVPVVHIHLIIGAVGSEQQVARRVAGDRQSCIRGSRLTHPDQSIVRLESRPAADCSIQRGKEKYGRPVSILNSDDPLYTIPVGEPGPKPEDGGTTTFSVCGFPLPS